MNYKWDNLKADQYHRLLQNGKSKKPEDLLWALTGKSKNEMTLHEINTMSVGNLDPVVDPTTAKIFVLDGQLYGMQDMNNMSFGLFNDIMDMGKDLKKYLPVIMTYLYRPVTKMSWWSTMKLKVIAKYGHRLNKTWGLKWIYKTMLNLDYSIEKYDPIVCEERVDILKNAPASTAHYAVTFFLTFSNQLQINSLKSLEQKMRMMKQTIKEMQESHGKKDNQKQN